MPNGWNMTRFLAVLGEAPYLDLLRSASTTWCNAWGPQCRIWAKTQRATDGVVGSA